MGYDQGKEKQTLSNVGVGRMKTWDKQDTLMLSIGIVFGLFMTIGGVYVDSNIIFGSGLGLVLATPLVAFMYNRKMKQLNKLLGLT